MAATNLTILQRKLPTISKTDVNLLNYAKNNTSQGGEDGILGEIFRRLTLSTLLSPENSFCVDIGAWDGKHLSNTYTFLTESSWAGLLVEANSDRSQELQALYDSRRSDITCVHALADISGDSSLLAILNAYNVPKDFAFLSIDIDGADYHLWKSISDDYHPMVICIEFNPSIPHDIVFIQPPICSVQQGSSLLALQELGQQLGYLIAAVTQFNAIFIRQDLIQQSEAIQEIIPVSQQLSSLHRPDMSTTIFQTYDGQLHLAGVQKLLWHRVGINIQQIQPLPKSQRHFPFAPPNNTTSLAATLSSKELIELMLYQPAKADKAWHYLQSRAMKLLSTTNDNPTAEELLDLCQLIIHNNLDNNTSSVQKQARRQLLQLAVSLLSVIKDSGHHCLLLYIDAMLKEVKLIYKDDDCAVAAWLRLQKLDALFDQLATNSHSSSEESSKLKMKWLKLMQDCQTSLNTNNDHHGSNRLRTSDEVVATVASAITVDSITKDEANG